MIGARVLVPAALALAAAGCGAPETPKAPQTAVQTTVGNLGRLCGEAHMVLAGSRDTATLRALDSRARGPAERLIAIARQNPEAVYLSSSMSELVATQASALSSCRLRSTARRLQAAHRQLS